MNEHITIYADGSRKSLKDALGIITPDWVEAGNSCHQTVIDLAVACNLLLGEIEGLRDCKSDASGRLKLIWSMCESQGGEIRIDLRSLHNFLEDDCVVEVNKDIENRQTIIRSIRT